MVVSLTTPGRRLAKRLLQLQVCVVLVTAILMVTIINVHWGISALIGGGIFIIANGVFASCSFLFSGARSAKLIVVCFFSGELLKILLIVVLFSVVYLYAEAELIPLKLAYLLVLGSNILAPVLFINDK
ncbi:F0F1 ATP synthase subunit I [Candidatus Enterovibrio escicola]|uniref:F0F1 ATP synthase subunit I n=1 Tax=Candidatus Enterovibrio escicola TaxID=1927127 RepID=UPI001237E1C7|nr:F0F1 ATP synthase subunit I [Candidatus Enterovibrio escacola]